MNEIVDYQYQRIVTLQTRVAELEKYILELCDKNCTSEYKKLVLTELFNNNLKQK